MRSRDVYRVRSPIPELGAQVGDLIEFDPSEEEPLLLVRRLPARALQILATHHGLDFSRSEPLPVKPPLEVSEGGGKPARGRKRKPPKLEVLAG